MGLNLNCKCRAICLRQKPVAAQREERKKSGHKVRQTPKEKEKAEGEREGDRESELVSSRKVEATDNASAR